MGWFENQIQDRRDADQQLLEDSFLRIASVIMGEESAERIADDRIITKNAIDEILKYYHYKSSATDSKEGIFQTLIRPE